MALMLELTLWILKQLLHYAQERKGKMLITSEHVRIGSRETVTKRMK